jgi:uncharacterized coiled-coil protein SlyX
MAPLHFEPPPDDPKDTIHAPDLPPDDLRYKGECQKALQPHFDDLIARALAAKWEMKAVASALMILAAQRLQDSEKEMPSSQPLPIPPD